jgi:hypothetical protein
MKFREATLLLRKSGMWGIPQPSPLKPAAGATALPKVMKMTRSGGRSLSFDRSEAQWRRSITAKPHHRIYFPIKP